LAEGELPYVPIGREASACLESGLICDLNEGHAPYRPRYILPEYSVLMDKGSAYLDLSPPKDFYEAVDALLIAYGHVPSITGYPVYLGDVDKLLEPFADSVSDRERESLLRLFLTHVDRSFPDAFVHMDLGPEDSRVGRDLIRLSAELARAVPNISLRVSRDTPDSLLVDAAKAALAVGKPYFVNHEALVRDIGPDYAVASCYNTLRRGGGSHTLARLSLKKLAERSGLGSLDAFLATELPAAVDCLAEIINARARFVVEEARFFETSFLAREGMLHLDRFTSMAGVFGLYEAVEILTGGARMAESEEADEAALRIVSRARDLVKSKPGAHCDGYGGKLGFHAQSGIDTDVDVTPGVRIKYGREAPLPRQLLLEGRLQSFFDAGVSEIAVFDRSAKAKPEAVASIARGALQSGIKVFAVIGGDSELIRITGYLVKRSDVEKRRQGLALREGTVALGADSLVGGHILERKERVLG
jgi:YjjI family glycine radical enzyme